MVALLREIITEDRRSHVNKRSRKKCYPSRNRCKNGSKKEYVSKKV